MVNAAGTIAVGLVVLAIARPGGLLSGGTPAQDQGGGFLRGLFGPNSGRGRAGSGGGPDRSFQPGLEPGPLIPLIHLFDTPVNRHASGGAGIGVYPDLQLAEVPELDVSIAVEPTFVPGLQTTPVLIGRPTPHATQASSGIFRDSIARQAPVPDEVISPIRAAQQSRPSITAPAEVSPPPAPFVFAVPEAVRKGAPRAVAVQGARSLGLGESAIRNLTAPTVLPGKAPVPGTKPDIQRVLQTLAGF